MDRIKAVDGLRAVAVVMVLCCHCFDAARGGGIGVDVFFVLSGYLITRIILTAVIILDISLRESSPLARLLSWPPLVYTGVISYGIYLWHFPLLYFIRSTPLDTAAARAALAFGLTPIIATISYWQFERKITQLKHRLPAAKALSFAASISARLRPPPRPAMRK